MALTGKEKQAKFRAKMKKSGYKLVQLWVKDKDSEEFKDYMRKLDMGVRRPKTSLKWDCERVVLEMHSRSREVMARDRKAWGVFEKMLGVAVQGYKDKVIPKYVYLDIVELLRPLLGDEWYKRFKTEFEEKRPRKRLSQDERMFITRLFVQEILEEFLEPLDPPAPLKGQDKDLDNKNLGEGTDLPASIIRLLNQDKFLDDLDF